MMNIFNWKEEGRQDNMKIDTMQKKEVVERERGNKDGLG